MNKTLLKLTTAVSTAVLLTGSVASVAFGTTTVTVTGNGADSNNTANVSSSNTTVISQSNDANIQNNVNIDATTGGNTADKNTGGDTSISTGDANVSSSVSNSANSNVASLACGTCNGNTDVKIAGNGADSKNTVNLQNNNDTELAQTNEANVLNRINVDSKTGKNTADKNTGGDTSIDTGNASATVDVTNNVNQNVAQIGGGNGGSTFSAEISGNGADSNNTLNLDLGNSVVVAQSNDANIRNSVEVDASSGYNKANKNTGGDTSIDTGNADANVGVTNKANSNALDLSSCDCLVDGSVKIAGNGADSKNTVNFSTESVLEAAQTNDSNVCNDVNVENKTGGNKANENTIHGADPMIDTGNASGDTSVNTQVNSNTIGNLGNLSMPDFSSVHDLNGLLVLLMGMFHSS